MLPNQHFVQVDEVLSLCEQINDGFLTASDVLSSIEFSKQGTVLESSITAADLAVFALLASDEAVRFFS